MLPLKKWLQGNRYSIVAALCIVFMYLCLFAVGITCPIKHVTGISCPGCGMSRAWFHALTLDFAGAFAYHPLFWLVPAALVMTVLQKRHRPARLLLYAVMVSALAVYSFRMADPTDTVVVFAPREGLFARLLRELLALFGLWTHK